MSGLCGLLLFPSASTVVVAVVLMRVMAFVFVRPQKEEIYLALPVQDRVKTKLLADSVARKVGDFVAPFYGLLRGGGKLSAGSSADYVFSSSAIHSLLSFWLLLVVVWVSASRTAALSGPVRSPDERKYGKSE